MHKRTISVSVALSMLLSGANLPLFANQLLRGPYLQQGDTDSMMVKWRTELSTDSLVRYGTTPNHLNMTVYKNGSTKNHAVSIEGLSPNTRYYYEVGSQNLILSGNSSHYFETSPGRGEADPTRIWVIGDSGTANSNARAVYNAYINHTGSTYTDLWLMLGDNAYNDGTDAQYQDAVFDMYPELLRQTPLWSTLGNHDGYTADSASESGPYYDIFSFPRHAEVGGIASGTEAYYSFDHGNIHFIVLDSYETNRSTSGAMMQWMIADLQHTTAEWIIAFWHHPPYTKGSHNSDSERQLIEMRENFLPVLESYGVDLVLSGHSHAYERSMLIDGHYGKSSSFSSSHAVDSGSGREDASGAYHKTGKANAGTVYAVAGASGKISGGSLNHPAMYVSLNQLGSMVIDINGNRADVKYLRHNGNVSDYFTITKQTASVTPPAAPASLTGKAASSSRINLVWQDQADNEIRFDISRSLNGSDFSIAGTAGANSETFADKGLTPNTTYFYRVRAANSAGHSSWTAMIPVTTHKGSPVETVTLQDGQQGYAGTEDSYIASGYSSGNFGGNDYVNADGDDGSNGELIALFKFDLSALPETANITEASLDLRVFNESSGTYNLYVFTHDWAENAVTWANANPDAGQGVLAGRLVPTTPGLFTILLNDEGIGALNAMQDNPAANFGFMLRSTGTANGVDLRSSEYGIQAERPALHLTYETGITQTLPASPSHVEAPFVSFNRVHLNWTDNADNETGFEIERSLSGEAFNLIGSTLVDQTGFTDTQVTANTTYIYRVLAKNGAGKSAPSETFSVTTADMPEVPSAPANLVLDVQSASAIALGFEDNSVNETGFVIERLESDNTWQEIAQLPVNTTQYTDTGLEASTSYSYRVLATNAAGSSAPSNVATATTEVAADPVIVKFRQGHNNYEGAMDTWISRGNADANHSLSTVIESDGDDGSNGELIGLFRFDLSTIPASATITRAQLKLQVSDVSTGIYGLYTMTAPWNESSATWNNTQPDENAGSKIGAFTPSVTGGHKLELNAAGVALIQGWIDGSIPNRGFMIRSEGTTNGVIVRSSEYFRIKHRPRLIVHYE